MRGICELIFVVFYRSFYHQILSIKKMIYVLSFGTTIIVSCHARFIVLSLQHQIKIQITAALQNESSSLHLLIL